MCTLLQISQVFQVLSSWQTKSSKTQPKPSESNIRLNSLGTVIIDENHGYKIVGLDNPANFCYMNSIIQLFVCLLLHSGCTYTHLVTSQRFFPNALLNYRFKNGYKLHYRKRNLKILRSWFTKGSNAIPLLDGTRQQDVHEAFLKVCEILHDGTKQCLIPDLPHNLHEDSVMTSFPRFLFRFLIETTVICQQPNCMKSSKSEEFRDELRISIQNHSNIAQMVNSVWTSDIEKTCVQCNTYGNHVEKIVMLSHPKVLRLVIMRFSNTLQKINTKININPVLNIFGKQLQLLSSINHHGTSIRNGHYTATVKYNSWWHVNDNDVRPASLNCFKDNNTAYLVFFRQ